jgi:hypothetical protein
MSIRGCVNCVKECMSWESACGTFYFGILFPTAGRDFEISKLENISPNWKILVFRYYQRGF